MKKYYKNVLNSTIMICNIQNFNLSSIFHFTYFRFTPLTKTVRLRTNLSNNGWICKKLQQSYVFCTSTDEFRVEIEFDDQKR